jgi:hypothetical protein
MHTPTERRTSAEMRIRASREALKILRHQMTRAEGLIATGHGLLASATEGVAEVLRELGAAEAEYHQTASGERRAA